MADCWRQPILQDAASKIKINENAESPGTGDVPGLSALIIVDEQGSAYFSNLLHQFLVFEANHGRNACIRKVNNLVYIGPSSSG